LRKQSNFILKTIIIGAGMTGLSAARVLTQKGHDVIVLDKGRGIGGRMSTRTIEQAKADHGAQYFSAKSPEFKTLIKELVSNNVAKEWHLAQRENIRYIGTKGMNSIPKKLAESLNVKVNEKVVTIIGNTVKTESGITYYFDNLIITIPVPQVVELFANSKITPTKNDQVVLSSIKYEPCIAVMAVLKQPTTIPNGGIILENQPIAWIADNFQKGISPLPSVTLHASADYSHNRLENDLQLVSSEMLASVSQYIATETIISSQVHRWRYSLASSVTKPLSISSKITLFTWLAMVLASAM
jgi:renalase